MAELLTLVGPNNDEAINDGVIAPSVPFSAFYSDLPSKHTSNSSRSSRIFRKITPRKCVGEIAITLVFLSFPSIHHRPIRRIYIPPRKRNDIYRQFVWFREIHYRSTTISIEGKTLCALLLLIAEPKDDVIPDRPINTPYLTLKRWRASKPLIVITHDLSQIDPTDFVYVLKQGRVVKQGYLGDLENPASEDARQESEFCAMLEAQMKTGGYLPKKDDDALKSKASGPNNFLNVFWTGRVGG